MRIRGAFGVTGSAHQVQVMRGGLGGLAGDLGIRIALGLDGFSEADQAVIEQAIPAAERLLDDLKIAAPLIEKWLPDIVAVIPAAKIILQHAKGTTK